MQRHAGLWVEKDRWALELRGSGLTSLVCSDTYQQGKIIHALNDEGKVWSSWHVRRGDLQYKEVKIPIEQWYNTTKEVWQKGEVLYIATDERNKTFFDPLREKHELRFLDDYWDVAKLGEIDKYDLGMLDTIVGKCSSDS